MGYLSFPAGFSCFLLGSRTRELLREFWKEMARRPNCRDGHRTASKDAVLRVWAPPASSTHTLQQSLPVDGTFPYLLASLKTNRANSVLFRFQKSFDQRKVEFSWS